MTIRKIVTTTFAATVLATTLGLASTAEAGHRHRDQVRNFAPRQHCVWQGRAKRNLARRSVRIVQSHGFRRVYDVDCQRRMFRIKGSAKVYRNGRVRYTRWTRWVNPRSGQIHRYNPVYSAYWR